MKNATKTREERLLERFQKARLELTEEEIQFFPKTNSMPDQPECQWTPSEQVVTITHGNPYF